MAGINQPVVEQPAEPDSTATVAAEQEIGGQVPVGQEAPVQTVTVEGREMTPEQVAQAYSNLHREYTKATQDRNTFARVLEDFGLLDEGQPGQVATPGGVDQSGYGVGQSAVAAPTTLPPASAPYGNAPQPPIEAQAEGPAVSDRLTAVEAMLERIDFGRRHPDMDDTQIDRVEQLRNNLETRYGFPHRLQSVWAEVIVADAQLNQGRQTAEQVRQRNLQGAQAAQRQAGQTAPPVMSGAGNPAMQPPPPARTVDEVVARLAGQAAEEMAGQGHE